MSAEHDFRGLRCPLPVLRARRVLKGMEAGAEAIFLLDDPKARADFGEFCRLSGWRIVDDKDDINGGGYSLHLKLD